MTEQQYDPHEAARQWRPYAPSPFVTHQDIAPMHTKIGGLEKGQESILQAFAGYRAEMLTRMDRIEAMLTVSAQDRPGQTGVTLSMREIIVFIGALIMVGAIFGRVLQIDRLFGG